MRLMTKEYFGVNNKSLHHSLICWLSLSHLTPTIMREVANFLHIYTTFKRQTTLPVFLHPKFYKKKFIGNLRSETSTDKNAFTYE
jgi:hypothetical protein